MQQDSTRIKPPPEESIRLAELIYAQLMQPTPDARRVKQLVADGADIEAKGPGRYLSETQTLLDIALERGSGDICLCLIKAGAKISINSEAEWQAIHFAVFDAEALQEVLAQKVGINAPSATLGYTALIMSVKEDKSQIFDMLIACPDIDLDRQSDITQTSPTNGATALLEAIILGREDMAIKLVQAGARRHIKDGRGKDAEDYLKAVDMPRLKAAIEKQKIRELAETMRPLATPRIKFK